MKLCLKSVCTFIWCLRPSLHWSSPRLWYQSFRYQHAQGWDGKERDAPRRLSLLGAKSALWSLTVVYPRVKFCLPHPAFPQLAWGPAFWPWQASLQPHCSSHFRVKAHNAPGCGGSVNAPGINPSSQQGAQHKLSFCPTNGVKEQPDCRVASCSCNSCKVRL